MDTVHSHIPQFSVQGAISGDIHFDDAENWTVGAEEGTDLVQVALLLLLLQVLLRLILLPPRQQSMR